MKPEGEVEVWTGRGQWRDEGRTKGGKRGKVKAQEKKGLIGERREVRMWRRP